MDINRLRECIYIYIYTPYILESNPHHFYSFRGLKNQMRSGAGFWKNDRAGLRAVRIQLFIILL
jgi:hypothetical protein